MTDVSTGLRPPCWCPSRWAPAWRLHTNRGKRFSAYIFHKKNCCDLNLGESLCISTFFLFPDSRLNLLNGFHFFILTYFEWRDTENQQYPHPSPLATAPILDTVTIWLVSRVFVLWFRRRIHFVCFLRQWKWAQVKDAVFVSQACAIPPIFRNASYLVPRAFVTFVQRERNVEEQKNKSMITRPESWVSNNSMYSLNLELYHANYILKTVTIYGAQKGLC